MIEAQIKEEVLFERLKSIKAPPTEQEFRAMELCQDALTPLLLGEVDRFVASPNDIEAQGKDYIRHILAIFMLAYFRERRAYSKITQLLTCPSQQILPLTGEVFTEALSRILASVYDGNLNLIQAVVENETLDPWIRAGALDSLMVLWKEGVLSRSEVMAYLKDLLTYKLERKPSYVWDAAALIAYDLHPEELVESLKDAIAEKLIEPVVLNETLLSESLAHSFHDVMKQKMQVVDGYMKSPFVELSWWLYPDRKLLQKGKDYEALDVPIVDKDVVPGERAAPMGWRSTTVVHHTKKLGRNDLCLCGSGKKYKKCCLGR